jgi:hypothetical protein
MNLETDNPEKGKLLQRSAHHRELIEEEVKLISERSEKIITNALIIGGALALTYFIVSGLSGSGEKKKAKARKIKLVDSPVENDSAVEAPHSEPEQAGIVSQIGSVLVAQATGFLLSIAREKLVEFLQSQSAKKSGTNEHP